MLILKHIKLMQFVFFVQRNANKRHHHTK